MPPKKTNADDLDITARASLATWLLLDAGNYGMTARELADKIGMTPGSARRMIKKISAVVPIYYEEYDGKWRVLIV